MSEQPMDYQGSHRRRSRFGRHRHHHRHSRESTEPTIVPATLPDGTEAPPSASPPPRHRHRHHRHHHPHENLPGHHFHFHHRHHRHHNPGLGRLFVQHFRSVAQNSLHTLYDGLLSQFPNQEMSAQYQDLLARSQAAEGLEGAQEMHEFIDDPRGPPPPYNPYAPPPRASANIVTDFLQDPVSSSLQGFSKVTRIVQNRTPILNLGIAGAQAIHSALTTGTKAPGTAERIYPELPTNPDHSGPSGAEEEQAPPPPLPILDNTVQANRLEPLGREEFNSKKWTLDELMIRVFKGGIAEDNEFRTRLWPFILELTDSKPESDVSTAEFDWSAKNKLFEHYLNQWQSILPDQEKRFSSYRERKSLIERDVVRCDRTHPYFSGDDNPNLETLKSLLMTYMMYDFDTGYVQGMTDLASPLVFVADGCLEKSFWFFANVMDFTHFNFEMSQNTIKLQLDMLWKMIQFTDPVFAEYLAKNDSVNCYFAFRWIVCQFKREFMKDNDGYNDIVLLWESIWTCGAQKRHLLKLRKEKKAKEEIERQEEERKKKIEDEEKNKKDEEERKKKLEELRNNLLINEELCDPESPLIDLMNVSMKELQEKAIAKEMSKMEIQDNNNDESMSSEEEASLPAQGQNKESLVDNCGNSSNSPSTSSAGQKVNAKPSCSKVPNSRSEPVLNYFIPRPKRLSDTELYVLCICLCIIRRERDLIMARKFDATEILKHFNTLELNGDLKDILIHAANIWSWMIYDEKEELLYAELQPSSSSDSNLANSSSNLNADDEYDLLTDVLVGGEDGFLT